MIGDGVQEVRRRLNAEIGDLGKLGDTANVDGRGILRLVQGASAFVCTLCGDIGIEAGNTDWRGCGSRGI